MKDLRWFRLLLFCIGVYFAGTGAIHNLNLVRWAVGQLAGGYAAAGDGIAVFLVNTLFYFIPCLFTLGFGIYLMKGGGKLTKWVLRRAESHCMRCDSDLRGVTSNRCPECGLEFESVKNDATASSNAS